MSADDPVELAERDRSVRGMHVLQLLDHARLASRAATREPHDSRVVDQLRELVSISALAGLAERFHE
jgi:hypothetical protein